MITNLYEIVPIQELIIVTRGKLPWKTANENEFKGKKGKVKIIMTYNHF